MLLLPCVIMVGVAGMRFPTGEELTDNWRHSGPRIADLRPIAASYFGFGDAASLALDLRPVPCKTWPDIATCLRCGKTLTRTPLTPDMQRMVSSVLVPTLYSSIYALKFVLFSRIPFPGIGYGREGRLRDARPLLARHGAVIAAEPQLPGPRRREPTGPGSRSIPGLYRRV